MKCGETGKVETRDRLGVAIPGNDLYYTVFCAKGQRKKRGTKFSPFFSQFFNDFFGFEKFSGRILRRKTSKSAEIYFSLIFGEEKAAASFRKSERRGGVDAESGEIGGAFERVRFRTSVGNFWPAFDRPFSAAFNRLRLFAEAVRTTISPGRRRLWRRFYRRVCV